MKTIFALHMKIAYSPVQPALPILSIACHAYIAIISNQKVVNLFLKTFLAQLKKEMNKYSVLEVVLVVLQLIIVHPASFLMVSSMDNAYPVQATAEHVIHQP